MKKNATKLMFFGTILSLGIVSCKKQERPVSDEPGTNSVSLTETTKANFFAGKEVSYTPVDKEAIKLITKRFIDHTEFRDMSQKTTIYDLQDPDVNAGAWLFEAASNYLENSNNVVTEDDEVNFSIIIDKRTTGELEGTDLVAKFNAFISNLESYRATEGYKPKIIDIRIGIDNEDELELLANVTFGVEGIGQYAFPTNNVTYQDAAQIYLTGSVTQAARILNTTYMQVANPNGSQTPNGIFLSGVTSFTTYLYNDINGGQFYFSHAANLYPFTLFQDEHDRIYNKLLDYCGSNSIQTTKLWSVSISPDAINTGGITYGVHKISLIKTADVNVM